jgi:hypothetical protein
VVGWWLVGGWLTIRCMLNDTPVAPMSHSCDPDCACTRMRKIRRTSMIRVPGSGEFLVH